MRDSQWRPWRPEHPGVQPTPSSRAPGPLRPARTIQSCRPTLATAPPRSSRPSSSSGSPLSSAPPSNALGLEGSLAWFNHSPPDYLYHHQPFSTVESLPSTVSHDPPFDTFSQESELWADLDLSLAESDWTSLSINHSTPYPTSFDGVTVSDVGYGMASTFASLSDSGPNESQSCLAPSVTASSANSQDGHSHASPVSQIPGSVTTSLSSPSTSHGDEALSRVESSRVEKRRLNTLAARRCRQRRADRMQGLEAELDAVRKERDELKLRVSKLEGETEALKTLLSRKSK